MLKYQEVSAFKNQKEVVIVAGANGSGKTTFARKFLDVTKYEFLNADEIAKELSPEDPTQARIAAGKKVIKLISECIETGASFVIESTLSGTFLEKHIKRLKEEGYKVSIAYIFLVSKELCKERIKSRVLQGGHYVPDIDVERRFDKGLVRFWNHYRLLVDYISVVFNNEYYDFKRIVHGKANELEIIDRDLYESFLKEIRGVSNGK